MTKKSQINVRQAKLPEDLDHIKSLWYDYLVWGNNQMEALYGVHPHNPKEAVEADIKQIHKFQPPYGQLITAIYDGTICGLGSLKNISLEIGEIKRMFVDPDFRGLGAGRAILEGLLAASKQAGYKKVRLDSPKFMEAAHGLYRSFGFRDIDPYPEMEIPTSFIDYMLFMELDLTVDSQ
ncbi:GNAT family N-acetyltransferase [Gaetbulibacter sp. M240]|uniref:GNAT family N-acetyltransferase n=1 Tax=Gaetbulibacter sp. M240 TaxID=3126511 RepID=UPI00374E5BB8